MEDMDSEMQDTEASVEATYNDERVPIPDVGSNFEPDKSEEFDQESVREALAKMFILDELPFKLVEREGFKTFMSLMVPEFQLPSRTTLIKDCYQIYMDEKLKLKDLLSKVTSRICLSMSTWTSAQKVSYLRLTAHFIDQDWKLHRKILNFSPIFNHKGDEIGRSVEWCLIRWLIKNVGTLTVENSCCNGVAMLFLKDKLHSKDSLLFGGEFFHIRSCSTNLLKSIVRDCLDEPEVQTSLARIRDAVKYVRSSRIGAEKFEWCIKTDQKINCSSSICLDFETRWNTTYAMLDSVLNFQRAFESLEEEDPKFVNALTDGAPTIDDWNNASSLLKLLEIFYDASIKLSGSHVTSSSYFRYVSYIQVKLDEWTKSSEVFLLTMDMKMKEKFTKYRGSIDEINMLLLVSVVLDPCYKVDFLRFALTKLYPSEAERVDSFINHVIDTMKRLFEHYKKIEPTSQPVSANKPQEPLKMDVDHRLIEGDVWNSTNLGWKRYREEMQKARDELELQRYLEDCCEQIKEDEDFDILAWWKTNSNRYPVLSRIAQDVLSIPVSTIDSESAGNFEDPALGQFHSSLTPNILESLICAKNWLQYPPPAAQDLEEFRELQNLDSVVKDLETAGAPSCFWGMDYI